MENNRDFEEMFKALGSEPRIQILEILKQGPRCVNAIVKETGFSQSMVSQNLRILRYANLVRMNKNGRFVHYSLNKTALKDLKEFVETLLKGKDTNHQDKFCKD